MEIAHHYLIRRKVFTFLGAKFQIYDATGALVGFCHQKAFKLKEDIRIYRDETQSEEVLSIRARQIVDFSAAYDVVDPVEHVKLGSLRRKGWKSILRDSWEFMDPDDNVIGTLQEDSAGMAAVRRFLTNLIPQKFHADINGRPAATYKQHFNPFIFKLDVTIETEAVDPRLLLAAGVLLTAIEGRQN